MILERLAANTETAVSIRAISAIVTTTWQRLSRNGRVAEAIEWHVGPRPCRNSWCGVPAVVRHRSDLAISLNNLGVAYCRAGRVDESDAPFARARELFATLSSDYPDELAYASVLSGASLDDQALAPWPGRNGTSRRRRYMKKRLRPKGNAGSEFRRRK